MLTSLALQTYARIVRQGTPVGRPTILASSFGKPGRIPLPGIMVERHTQRQLREYPSQDGHTHFQGVGVVGLWTGYSWVTSVCPQEEPDLGFVDEGASGGECDSTFATTPWRPAHRWFRGAVATFRLVSNVMESRY